MIDAVRRRATRPPEQEPSAPEVQETQRITRIRPTNRYFSLDFRELWHYRELGLIIAWRDIKVRYKQTALGFAWAILVPLMTMVVLTLVFNKGARVGAEYGVPYPLWSYVGVLPWTYFTSCLTQSSSSVVSNSPLVTKVYFPRLLIPLGSVISPLVDLGAAGLVLVGLFAYYQRAPHWHTVALPAFMLLALLTALGMGLWLSALSVRYRDIPYTIPFLIQILFFLSPVAYPVANLPQAIRPFVSLNPMTGVIDGIRWVVLGTGTPHYTVYTISALMGIAVLATGLVFFRHTEKSFADMI